MSRGRENVQSRRPLARSRGGVAGAERASAQASKAFDGVPRFTELTCNSTFGPAAGVGVTMKCGTVTVPQDRAHPKDSRLIAVVLPVVVYSSPGAHGNPVMFLPGGPGESSIDAAQRVLLETPAGQSLLRDHPIIAFDRRGFSPVPDRASPDLGTILFEPRARRDLAVKPLNDSLVRRAKDLRAHGVDPANFTTLPAVEDIADVTHALGYQKLILFGASYGSRESLHFMRRHPDMVEASILDGVAPPSATQFSIRRTSPTRGARSSRRWSTNAAPIRSASPSTAISRSRSRSSPTAPAASAHRAVRHADPWHTIEVAGGGAQRARRRLER